ncbi:Hypothetical protein CINCED_3A025622 [Cinara cedri]|uniref:Uncharacterized protein n=1 Tax=Cinara cedri TaxID=506608 RepID=A0A5E4NIW6_9HEMI|nr:Hypothetical protein CINCED_3A025622 [Cinara cedri]
MIDRLAINIDLLFVNRPSLVLPICTYGASSSAVYDLLQPKFTIIENRFRHYIQGSGGYYGEKKYNSKRVVRNNGYTGRHNISASRPVAFGGGVERPANPIYARVIETTISDLAVKHGGRPLLWRNTEKYADGPIPRNERFCNALTLVCSSPYTVRLVRKFVSNVNRTRATTRFAPSARRQLTRMFDSALHPKSDTAYR